MAQLLLAFLLTAACSWSPAAQEIYAGSGFFVTANGYFVTNYHVIRDAGKIGLRDMQGNIHEAVVVKLDTNNDLALLKVKGARFSALPVVNSQTVKRGTHVVTVGFPNIDVQGTEPKLSEGIVSALSGIQDEPTVFQISVPIQQGSSGGAMVNMDGNVVGIIASKLSALYMLKNRGSVPENVNYAIKSNYLNELIQTDLEVRKSLPPPSRRPAKNLVELSARVEKASALVFAIGKNVNVFEASMQCIQKTVAEKQNEALPLCTQAAEHGDASAQYYLGKIYWDGVVVVEDYQEAFKWFRLAATQGHADAQTAVGSSYLYGQGIFKDYYQAEKWLRLAAGQGQSGAQLLLGFMHTGGMGVTKDDQEALGWYRLSAAQGNAGAQTMLSLGYITGKGVPTNFLRAYMWASLSARQETGHKSKAQELLGIATRRLTPEQISEAQELAAQCELRKYKDCE